MPDILIAHPPRPSRALEFLRQNGPILHSPTQELALIANALRRQGYDAEILDGDLLSEDEFSKKIGSSLDRAKIVVFFCRAYRLPNAQRAAVWLRRNSTAHNVATVALGYLGDDSLTRRFTGSFDELILGPDWIRGLGTILKRQGVAPGAALCPIIDLGEFEDLTGVPGPCACIAAPSFGCSHSCTFCEHQILKGFSRTADWLAPRPLGETMAEIDAAWDAGARSDVFLESNFMTYPDWIAEFASAIRKRHPSIRFGIHTRLTDFLDRRGQDLLAKLIDAGLHSVCCGLESGNDQTLKRIRKDATVAEYVKADEILRRSGARRFYSIVLGFPGESAATIRATWNLMRRLNPDGLQTSIATPLPGTPLFAEVKRLDLLATEDLEQYYYYGSAVIDLPGLPRSELLDCQTRIHHEFSRTPRRQAAA